jgi:hypothetical protein
LTDLLALVFVLTMAGYWVGPVVGLGGLALIPTHANAALGFLAREHPAKPRRPPARRGSHAKAQSRKRTHAKVELTDIFRAVLANPVSCPLCVFPLCGFATLREFLRSRSGFLAS